MRLRLRVRQTLTVLLDSRRIVLPLPAIRPILNLLHTSHSGINKTITLARGLYYWPGMVNDINFSLCNMYPGPAIATF